ncbi:hypothetical protein K439DRAFT_1290986, partial [Ramaria rubella]
GRTQIPTLKVKDDLTGLSHTASSNEEKSNILFNSFFPPPLLPLPSSLRDENEYPLPKFDFIHMTKKQIQRAILRLSPFKAPGPNGIPNCVLIQCAEILIPHLEPLFNATFDWKIYPKEWKDSVTAIVHKPGKSLYSRPGAFHPIALLDTIGKVLSSCIAEDYC